MSKADKNQEPIDFVILWVDGNDPKWREERAKYSPKSKTDTRDVRYRDLDILQYWFRGVEKNAPWVRTIHFVTCGQYPEWLNKNHPKLHCVEHKDFIPEEYLPTFNSNTILLNIHKIPGLSENFVMFNDDCFLTKPVSKEDFFVDGLPVDMFMEYPVGCYGNDVMSHMFINNFNLIGRYFTRKDYLKRLRSKILSPKYGATFFYNLLISHIPYPQFFGVLNVHIGYPHMKSTFYELWDKERECLENTCKHRFRSVEDVSEYIFRMWFLMKGDFVPGNRMKMGKMFQIGKSDAKMYDAIKKGKYKMVCINDDCEEEQFIVAKKKLNKAFKKLMPEKSAFEK